MPTTNLAFAFGIPSGAAGQSAYQEWVTLATANDYPQPSGTISDMFDWLASQAAGDITATATVTPLAADATPTVTVTVTTT